MEDRGGKGLLFLQSVVTLAHSPRPCFIFPVSVHVDDVCTTGSCRNVLIKRWRKGKRTTEGYNWHWKIFIHELLCIKKRTSERRERVSFFYAWQQVNKNRSSIFHGVMFLFHTYWNFFLLKAVRLLPSSVKYFRSCLRLDERCIFSHSLSMYEIIMCPAQLQKCLSRYRSAPLCHKSAWKKKQKCPFLWLSLPPHGYYLKAEKKDLPPRLRC